MGREGIDDDDDEFIYIYEYSEFVLLLSNII